LFNVVEGLVVGGCEMMMVVVQRGGGCLVPVGQEFRTEVDGK